MSPMILRLHSLQSSVLVGFLFLLKTAICNLYKKCFLDILEFVFYCNILFPVYVYMVMYFLGNNSNNDKMPSHISVIVSIIVLLLLILLYHLYMYWSCVKIHQMRFGQWMDSLLEHDTMRQLINDFYRKLDDVHKSNELLDVTDQPLNNDA